MGQQFNSAWGMTAVATGTVVGQRFVKPSGASGTSPGIAQSGAGENAYGVARYSAATGEKTMVDTLGSAVCEAGAAVACGDTVKADASGRAITWVTSGARLGIALEAAGAAGQFIEVMLIPQAV